MQSSLYIMKTKFTPKLIPTMATLALLPLLMYLGFWQISRGHFKQKLINEFQSRLEQAPVNISELLGRKTELNKLRYQPVKLTGHFDNKHQLLLDNQFYHHRVGYYVLTPFILNTGDKTILINRGWIPLTRDRSVLPKIKAVNGTHSLNGLMIIPEKKPFVLDKRQERPGFWPMRVEFIDPKLYPFVVALSADQPFGFKREWKPALTMPPEKHFAYAFQWFALALTLLIIYISVNIKRTGKDNE